MAAPPVAAVPRARLPLPGTGYARYFNRRHDRVGHLFQNRFRSRRVVDDADLIGLVRYVSRNPLAAGLVATALDLETHPWCGVASLLGHRLPLAFEAMPETLQLFDEDPARARRRIRDWLEVPAPDPDAPRSRRPAAPAVSSAAPPAVLLRQVCTTFGVRAEALRSRSRSRQLAAAREAFALRAVAEYGVSGAEIARALGVTRAAVSLMLARVRLNNLTS